jgi:hypothetical protein
MPKVDVFEDKDGRQWYRHPKTGEKTFIAGNLVGEPSPTKAFLRGLAVQGPANLAGIADFPANRVTDAIEATTGTQGQLSRLNIGGRTEQALAAAMPSLANRPQSGGGKLLQAAGAGITESLPFAAVGPELAAARAGSGLARLASRLGVEAVTGAGAEVSRQGVENLGGGPRTQAGASLVGGITGRSLLGLTGIVGRGAARMASAGIRERAARELAQESFREEVPEALKAASRKALQEEMTTPLFGRATTEQVLAEVSPGLKFSGEVDPALRAEIFQQNKANAEAARDFGSRMLPGGNPTAAVLEYESRLDKIAAKTHTAYAKVGNIEGMPIEPLDEAARTIRLEAGKQLNWLPKDQLDIIDKFQREVGFVSAEIGSGPIIVREASFKDLQNLRSDLFEAGQKAAKSGEFRKAKFINTLTDAVEKVFDDVAEAGGSREVNALRKARAVVRATAAPKNAKDEFKRLGDATRPGFKFREQHPLWKVFDGNLGDDADMAADYGKFLRGRNVAVTLGRLKRSLGGNPDAWAGVQQLTRNEIFGENFEKIFDVGGDLSKSGAESVLQTIAKKRSVIDTAWGPGTADNATAFVRRARQLATGSTTEIEKFSKLSVPDPHGLQAVGNVAEIGTKNMARAALRAFTTAFGRLPSTREEANQFLMKAIADPQLAEGFLRPLKPYEMVTWKRRAALAMGRELARSSAGVQEAPAQ